MYAHTTSMSLFQAHTLEQLVAVETSAIDPYYVVVYFSSLALFLRRISSNTFSSQTAFFPPCIKYREYKNIYFVRYWSVNKTHREERPNRFSRRTNYWRVFLKTKIRSEGKIIVIKPLIENNAGRGSF